MQAFANPTSPCGFPITWRGIFTFAFVFAIAFGALALAAETSAPSTTEPAIPEMITCTDNTVGVTFARPAKWRVCDQAKDGDASIAYDEPEPWDGLVQATMRISKRDTPGCIQKVDVTTPADPTATVDKIFVVDGKAARLTAFKVPVTDKAAQAELLTVHFAKGSRLYRLSMVFATTQHDPYLALAEAICASMRLLPVT